MDFRLALKKIPEHNIILTIGNEPFYRDQFRNRVISLNKDCEVIKLDAGDMSESEILSHIGFRDLFSSKRVFCINNFTKIKNLEYFLDKKFSDIIVLDADSKGKSKAYKELEKKCLYVECVKPKPWEQEDDAVSKIKGYLTNSGLTIADNEAKYLFSHIGYNLNKLMKEMQKIVLFKSNSNSKVVTKNDINDICVLDLSYNIFDLVEKIIDGNKKEALNLLDKIYKFESGPAILLITVWYTHLENLLYLKTSKKDLSSNGYIKLPPSVITKKLNPQANKLSVEKILESLKFLTEIDYGLRKGSFDLKFYLEQFILNF